MSALIAAWLVAALFLVGPFFAGEDEAPAVTEAEAPAGKQQTERLAPGLPGAPSAASEDEVATPFATPEIEDSPSPIEEPAPALEPAARETDAASVQSEQSVTPVQPEPLATTASPLETTAPQAIVETAPSGPPGEPCSALALQPNLAVIAGPAALLEDIGREDPDRRVLLGDVNWKPLLLDERGGCRLRFDGAIAINDARTAEVTLVFREPGSRARLERIDIVAVQGVDVRPRPPRLRLSGGMPSVAVAGRVAASNQKALSFAASAPGGTPGVKDDTVLSMHWVDAFVTAEGTDYVLTALFPDAERVLGRQSLRAAEDIELGGQP